MAVINLKVKSDFAQASKDLKAFGNLSETEKKRIQKFQQAFTGDQIDKFIDKNRRAAAAIRATKGPLAATEAQSKALERQIQSLIKKGLDPQSESVQRLAKEYDKYTKEIEENTMATKFNEKASKAAGLALLGIAAGVGIAIGATTLMASEAEELQNKFSVVFGGIEKETESWINTYSDATAKGALETKEFLSSLQDIQTGYGASVESAAEFSKVTVGVTNDLVSFANVPFEQASAAIQSGLSGQFQALKSLGIGLNVAIIDQSNYAESLGKSWREMDNLQRREAILAGVLGQSRNAVGQAVDSWKDYDFTLGDAAQTSQSFANQQKEIPGLIQDIGSIIGTAFLPNATEMIIALNNGLEGFREFISTGTNLEDTLGVIAVVLSGVTAGLVAFILVSQGSAIVAAMSAAVAGLSAAFAFLAANPIILAVAGITAFVAGVIAFDNAEKRKSVDAMAEQFGNLAEAEDLAGAEADLFMQKLAHLSGRFDNILSSTDEWTGSTELIAGFVAEAAKEYEISEDAVREVFLAQEDLNKGVREELQLLDDIATKRQELAAQLSTQMDDRNGSSAESAALSAEVLRLARARRAAEAAAVEAAELEKQVALAKQYNDARSNVISILESEKSEYDKIQDKIEELQATPWATGELETDRLKAIEVLRGKQQAAIDAEIANAAKLQEEKLDRLNEYLDAASAAEDEARDAKAQKDADATQAQIEDAIKYAQEIVEIGENLSAYFAVQAQKELDSIQTNLEAAIWASNTRAELDMANSQRTFDTAKTLLEERQALELADMLSSQENKELTEAQKFLAAQSAIESESKAKADFLELQKSAEWQAVQERVALEEKQALELKAVQDKQAAEKIALEAARISEETRLEKAAFDEKARLEAIAAAKSRKILHDQAVFQKGVDLASAIVSTASGIAAAIPNPFLMALAGIAGGIQIATIASTPIPSAQTGTSPFGVTIPDSGATSRADQVGVVASPGETVRIDPRGEGGGGAIHVTVELAGQVVIDVIQQAVDSGDLRITTENIQRGISA